MADEQESSTIGTGIGCAGSRRLRISAPAADEVVAAWLEGQSDASTSIRLLIHDASRRFGSDDVFEHAVIILGVLGGER